MRLKFQADNDLRRRLIDATLRLEPDIDFQSSRTAGLDSLDDLEVLRIAAESGRILVTHDRRTLPKHLATFLALGNCSPGVLIVVPQLAPLIAVAETLQLIWADGRASDWENRVSYIPF